jgi:hypothetical protein
MKAETGMEPASNLPTTAYSTLKQGRGEEHNARGASWIPAGSSHPWDGYLIGPENELAVAAA